MVFGHVEPGEVVVVVLNFGAVEDFKAHAGEHVDDLVLDEGDRVQAAGRAAGAGQRDIDGLGLVAGLELGGRDLGGEGFIHALGPGFAGVDELAGRGAVFFGHIAQALGQAGHFAVFAQILLPEGGKFLLAAHGGAVGFKLRAQCVDFFFHTSHLPFAVVWARQNKTAPPPDGIKGRSRKNFL